MVWGDSQDPQVREVAFIRIPRTHQDVPLRGPHQVQLIRNAPPYPPHATPGQQVGDPLGRVVFLGHTEDFPHSSEGHLHGGGGKRPTSGPMQTPERAARDEEDHPARPRMPRNSEVRAPRARPKGTRAYGSRGAAARARPPSTSPRGFAAPATRLSHHCRRVRFRPPSPATSARREATGLRTTTPTLPRAPGSQSQHVFAAPLHFLSFLTVVS